METVVAPAMKPKITATNMSAIRTTLNPFIVSSSKNNHIGAVTPQIYLHEAGAVSTVFYIIVIFLTLCY